MKIDIVKHVIVNIVKSVTYGIGKVEKKFFRTILENMLEYKTTVLSQLGDTKEKTAKEWKNYFSFHLGKEIWKNLTTKIEKVMIKLIGKVDKESNFFCFDTVDINKYSAKKMEGLKIVRDGSKGELVNGFVFHSVSVKGIPLFLNREEIKIDRERGLKFEMFEEQLNKIKSVFGSGYWILADRGYDDFKKFKLLINSGFNFAIRLKTNRNVLILEGYNVGKTLLVGELKEGRYEVKIKGIEQSLFVFVKKLKGQEKPIKVISNIDDENVVLKYLERWEIERIFKTGKQEFDFEKIGTKSIQKTDNLVALVQLCLGINAYIFNKLNPKFGFIEEKSNVITLEKVKEKIKLFLKEKGLTLNRNSITSFVAYYMKFIKKMKFNLQKVTLKHCFSSQLSLNL